ncbi:hypothetical protein GCM10010102_07140 [Promicromonospora citrea]|uniref:Uncharacterized protein n=1 Tax=Promicromonospora citrea TaxID=43677 RepID=A0A8H9GEB4_9MICO|nr:hypothetical protein GCM10010102_07140 [Promicromonospora citrea]
MTGALSARAPTATIVSAKVESASSARLPGGGLRRGGCARRAGRGRARAAGDEIADYLGGSSGFGGVRQ